MQDIIFDKNNKHVLQCLEFFSYFTICLSFDLFFIICVNFFFVMSSNYLCFQNSYKSSHLQFLFPILLIFCDAFFLICEHFLLMSY
jgi:hypothetical protein